MKLRSSACGMTTMSDVSSTPPTLPPAGEDSKPAPELATSLVPPNLAPWLMMAFWMLLGAAAGIRLVNGLWHAFGLGTGGTSVAVPIGGVAGATAGAALGRITSPRLLVPLMAIFAGSSAGGVASELAWGDIGRIGGQVVGGLLGGIAWATWLFVGGGRDRHV